MASVPARRRPGGSSPMGSHLRRELPDLLHWNAVPDADSSSAVTLETQPIAGGRNGTCANAAELLRIGACWHLSVRVAYGV